MVDGSKMITKAEYINAIQGRLPGWTKKDIRGFLVAQAEAVQGCLGGIGLEGYGIGRLLFLGW
jgi:hypothetical protein